MSHASSSVANIFSQVQNTHEMDSSGLIISFQSNISYNSLASQTINTLCTFHLSSVV